MIAENKIFSVFFRILIICTLSLFLLRGIFPVRYNSLIDSCCNRYGVEKALVLAVIKAESNFCENSISHASAKGIMQLTDSTFSYCIEKQKWSFDRPDIFDPVQNINAGIWYLSYLLTRYDGNVKNAVAAYNAGPSNVDKWLLGEDFRIKGIVPFPETDKYIRKVDKYTRIYRLLYR